MDFKTWWYDTNTTKWQIIFGTLLIGIVFTGTFAFLSTYQFEEWKYSGFAKSMIGILMGTVALGVITGVIIIFQSICINYICISINFIFDPYSIFSNSF